MTKTLTPKQEAFCLAYIETGNASKAYRHAYDADNMKMPTIYKEACNLLNNPKITPRIKQLQSQYAEMNRVTVESLTNELIKAQEKADNLDKPRDMISAIMGKAKLHGLLTQKVQHSGNIALSQILEDIAENNGLLPHKERVLNGSTTR